MGKGTSTTAQHPVCKCSVLGQVGRHQSSGLFSEGRCETVISSILWRHGSLTMYTVSRSDSFSGFRSDRTENSSISKGGKVCFMTNNKWYNSRNVSIMTRFCSPDLEHISIVCRLFYLPQDITSVITVAVYIPPQAETKTALTTLHNIFS